MLHFVRGGGDAVGGDCGAGARQLGLHADEAILVVGHRHVVGGAFDEPGRGDHLEEAHRAQVGDAVVEQRVGTEVDEVLVAGAAQALPRPGVGAGDTGERSGHPSRSP